MGWVFYRSAKDLVGERGGVSLTQEDEPHDVRDRVDVGPVKIDMRVASGGLLKIDQQRSDRVGDHGASGMKDAT